MIGKAAQHVGKKGESLESGSKEIG
jgi:hypothetical protein